MRSLLPGLALLAACRAGGTPTNPSLRQVQLLIAPASVSIQAGGTQQFSVTGMMSDGSTQSASAAFSATGGTITPQGLYTAGNTAGAFRVVAASTDGRLSDTAAVTVTVPAPAPILRQVILTPSAATVQAGGTQQFSASGRLSDGSTTSVAVTYSATGGTISSAGLYTAGNSSGTYRVIAAAAGANLADTSTVTITSASSTHSYTTNFPNTENPIAEGGRWINGKTTGIDWSDVSTTPGKAIGLQCCASYTDATAILTGTWGADQQATATVFTDNPPGPLCAPEVELRLRSAIVAHSNRGYEISFSASGAPYEYLIIVRWNGPLADFTYLLRLEGAQYGVGNGDVVSAKIVGNTIYAYKNGTLMGQASDGTYLTGTPGMGFNLENASAGCPGTNSGFGYSSFTATDSLP